MKRIVEKVLSIIMVVYANIQVYSIVYNPKYSIKELCGLGFILLFLMIMVLLLKFEQIIGFNIELEQKLKMVDKNINNEENIGGK